MKSLFFLFTEAHPSLCFFFLAVQAKTGVEDALQKSTNDDNAQPGLRTSKKASKQVTHILSIPCCLLEIRNNEETWISCCREKKRTSDWKDFPSDP
jgi:hypothetical protein